MTDAHENDSEEREDELMRRIVLGECELDAPEVQQRAAHDEAFARELEDLLLVRERLELAFDEDRAIIATATRQVGEADRRLVLSSLGNQLAETAAPRAAPGLRRGWLVALAATLLAAIALFVARPWQANQGDGRGTLSSEFCGHPVQEVEGYAPFVVDYPLPPGSRVRITVEDPDTGAELLASPDLRTTSWTPDDAEPLRDRERIRWTFTIDSPLVTGSAEAWLRR